jgi:PleD family two-component response regulator
MKSTNLEAAKVLVVDDSPDNLALLRQLLEPQGYSVSTAASGEEALERVAAEDPHLILLDMVMPGIDGLETCRRLKGSEETRDIPVVFVSARTDVQAIVEGFEVGGSDYVTRPLCAPELLARVRAHLELKFVRDVERRTMKELREALENVKLLSGIVPICGSCKKIREDASFRKLVQSYLEGPVGARFSYGTCPECLHALYPDAAEIS